MICYWSPPSTSPFLLTLSSPICLTSPLPSPTISSWSLSLSSSLSALSPYSLSPSPLSHPLFYGAKPGSVSHSLTPAVWLWGGVMTHGVWLWAIPRCDSPGSWAKFNSNFSKPVLTQLYCKLSCWAGVLLFFKWRNGAFKLHRQREMLTTAPCNIYCCLVMTRC